MSHKAFKTATMVAGLYGSALFPFGFQINFFHPDEMFYHLLLEFAPGFRDSILEI